LLGLSDFLRRVLQGGTAEQQVPHGERRDGGSRRKYLDIQKVRFARAAAVECGCAAGELYPAQVPSLILQPMWRNAGE